MPEAGGEALGWRLTTQAEWDELLDRDGDEAEPEPSSKTAACTCTSSGIDPDCDYFYFPAAGICALGGTHEDSDDSVYTWRGEIENQAASDLVVNCTFPLDDYYEFPPDHMRQVVFTGRNQYVGTYDLECYLYSAGTQDASWTQEEWGEIAGASSSVQAYELESFEGVDAADPLLAVACSIPRRYYSGVNYYSFLRGFRLCFDPDITPP